MTATAGERPDVRRVLDSLKDFQRETVEHVFARMYKGHHPARRFLLADEVGLGKTLVAKGLIAKAVDKMWDDVDRIDVVYICSNGDIARQNVRRLNVSPGDEFALASRITLLPTQIHDLRSRRLNFVSFTPRTSFDTRGGSGIASERALLYWMLRSEWGFGNKAGPKNVLQGGSYKENFRRLLREFDLARIDDELMAAFHRRLVDHDRLRKAEGERGLRERFDELSEQFKRHRKTLAEHEWRPRHELIGDLRAVLAAGCLTALEPDLVILDEFQRFKSLLDPHDDASKLARELFNYSDEQSQVRVLLLSATPYKMLTLGAEADGEDHYRDFVSTLDFLFGHDAKRTRDLEKLLAEYRGALMVVKNEGPDRLRELKSEVESRLKRVIARTERLAATEDRDGMLKRVPSDARLAVADVRAYAQTQAVANVVEHHNTMEYWKSAPYLLNYMDRYKFMQEVKRAARNPALAEAVGSMSTSALLPWRKVEGFGAVEPANARLRLLYEQLVESKLWQLLWMPPSLPYFRLGKPFSAVKSPTKRLVFSSWVMVPRATSTLLSFEAERAMFRSRGGNPRNTARAREKYGRPLDLRKQRNRLSSFPVLGLIYPSPTLAGELDPLMLSQDMSATGRVPSSADVVKAARRRVRELLRGLPVRGSAEGRVDESWYALAPMLIDLIHGQERARDWFGHPDGLASIAKSLTKEDSIGLGAQEHLDYAQQALGVADAGELTLGPKPRDLDRVVALQALSGFGTAPLRALARVTGEDDLWSHELLSAAGRTGSALRALFNAPEVTALIRGLDNREPYWLRALEYCVSGCLQAVLDEYAHILVEGQGLLGRQADEIAWGVADEMVGALTSRPAQLAVDDIRAGDANTVEFNRQRMRTRFAVAFNPDDRGAEEEASRPDQIRSAFNSPFWPFCLVSTSVGQEGLDFHNYCHAVVHWNIPANPVDLEQREGRVHRYKGHAVRKNVASAYGLEPLEDDGDPWTRLFALAKADRDPGQNDLVPFWLYPVEGGACIERHVPALPLSRDLERYEQLRRALAVYRIAFGQSRQDDLIAYLLSQMPEEQAREIADDLRIDLSPAS